MFILPTAMRNDQKRGITNQADLPGARALRARFWTVGGTHMNAAQRPSRPRTRSTCTNDRVRKQRNESLLKQRLSTPCMRWNRHALAERVRSNAVQLAMQQFQRSTSTMSSHNVLLVADDADGLEVGGTRRWGDFKTHVAVRRRGALTCLLPA